MELLAQAWRCGVRGSLAGPADHHQAFFFALPAVGVDISTFLAAAIGLTLLASANVVELVHAR